MTGNCLYYNPKVQRIVDAEANWDGSRDLVKYLDENGEHSIICQCIGFSSDGKKVFCDETFVKELRRIGFKKSTL